MPPTFVVKVDSAPALRAFRASRRDLGKAVKATLLDVGRTHALPTAKRNAPSILKSDVRVKATTRELYFTTGVRGFKRGRFWLLEHGGKIRRGFIATRPVPILRPGGGLIGFRMSVQRPRTIQGKRFLAKSVTQVRPTVVRMLERRIAQDIQRHLDKADVFK